MANILQLHVFQKGRFDSPYIWNVLTKWPGKKIIAYFMSVKNHSAVVSLIQRQFRQAGQDSMIFFLPHKVSLPMTSLIPSPRHPNSLTSIRYKVTIAIDNSINMDQDFSDIIQPYWGQGGQCLSLNKIWICWRYLETLFLIMKILNICGQLMSVPSQDLILFWNNCSRKRIIFPQFWNFRKNAEYALQATTSFGL